MAHFLALGKEKKTAVDLLAVIFAREMWKHHRLPMDIVSDWDSRFTSETWQEFLWLSSIRPRMSMAFHHQTDGQTERLNQAIEAYLWAFISHEQDNWVGLLPMAEFAQNNSITMGNGMLLELLLAAPAWSADGSVTATTATTATLWGAMA